MQDTRTRPPKGTEGAGKGGKGSSKTPEEAKGKSVFETDSKQVGQNFQYEQRTKGSYIKTSIQHKESVQARKRWYWRSPRWSKPAEADWEPQTSRASWDKNM